VRELCYSRVLTSRDSEMCYARINIIIVCAKRRYQNLKGCFLYHRKKTIKFLTVFDKISIVEKQLEYVCWNYACNYLFPYIKCKIVLITIVETTIAKSPNVSRRIQKADRNACNFYDCYLCETGIIVCIYILAQIFTCKEN